MQQIYKKLETLEKEVKIMKKQQLLPVVRLSDKEMTELEKARKEIKSENYLTEKEFFETLRK
ncbi:MAG: hypothetical protein AABW85_06220 [archaeon]